MRNVSKYTLGLGFSLGALILTGCSSLGVGDDEFSCNGIPEGVTCLPAREVYALTENRDGLEGYTAEDHVKKKHQHADSEKERVKNDSSPNGIVEGDVKLYNNLDYRYTESEAPAPLAMRSRVQNMRIWIAPWEDNAGDLNLSGYIYTEIKGRKWLLGETAVTKPARIVPLQVVRKKEPDSEKSAPKTNFNPLSSSLRGDR